MALPTGKHRSVDANRFAMVPRNDVPRSAFDVSYMHKTTFDAGNLIPIYCEEVLPGDSIRLNMSAFVRSPVTLVPIMDNLRLETFFFFVPNRLVWSNWKRFMGEQTSPTDTTQFLLPVVSIANAALPVESLYDYFGITLNNNGAAAPIDVNVLPFRAYNLIYNEWFRDQDINTMVVNNVGDGPDVSTDYVLLPRARRPDYFSTARPWPQKITTNFGMFAAAPNPLVGDFPGLTANFDLSTGGVLNQLHSRFSLSGGLMAGRGIGAPVTGIGVASGNAPTAGAQLIAESGGRNITYPASGTYSTATDAILMAANAPSGNFPDVRVLIQDIRTAGLIQGMLERNSRGGTRYTEIIRSHFGVLSPDARLQRPEYLGGGRTFVNIHPIAQTAPSGTTGGAPAATNLLGNLGGVGTAVATNHGFSQSFTEHGHIIGLLDVNTDVTYQNGINRMWWRRTPYDFYWPGLAHLGEQAILSKELFCNGTANDNEVFGYQERYSEYKYHPSRVSGLFRSSFATPLDFWHLGINYTVRPALNPTFINEGASLPIGRAMTVAQYNGQQFLGDFMFEQRMVRCMPMFSIPGVVGRL